MMYGVNVWYTPPTKRIGSRRNTGLVAVLRQMQKLQRMAALTMTGGMRSTPTDLLDTHAGVMPMELTLLQMPQSGGKDVHVARHAPTKHQSPIDHLLRIFELDPKKFETIVPDTTEPTNEDPFTSTIAETREESMETEEGDDARHPDIHRRIRIQRASRGGGSAIQEGAAAPPGDTTIPPGTSNGTHITARAFIRPATQPPGKVGTRPGHGLPNHGQLIQRGAQHPLDIKPQRCQRKRASRQSGKGGGTRALAEKQVFLAEIKETWKEMWMCSPRRERLRYNKQVPGMPKDQGSPAGNRDGNTLPL
ncbi:hypothetical protein B0H34DRAFT_674042 [Crassisporium funariophilum]|nr:hypothetical protein B0H34DRAFT_674042 [Crassisporium funariophilum]